MDLAAESTRNVLGRLHTLDFLPIYPHSSAPCHNLQKSIDVSTDIFPEVAREFSYEITCPVPINRPSSVSRQVINGMDPALQIVKQKFFWEKHKTELLKYCTKNSTDNISDADLKPGNTISVPFCVMLLGKHFSEDPDKYFNNNYNVYYSGGNLASLEVASEKYVVTPKKYGEEEFIYIERLSEIPNWRTSTPLFVGKSGTGSNNPVFQIESFENFIISRQSKKICLFLISESIDRNLEVRNILSQNSESPYFSVSLYKQLFCTTNSERNVEIFDITKQRLLLSRNFESEEAHTTDNWCSAHFVDENTLCYIDRTCIRFIDLRSETTAAKTWHISGVTEQCEEAYAGANGSRGIQYITTSHQLLSLDPRSGFSQRWTHGITHSPAYLSLPALDNGPDKIFIGSQVCDSVIYIENNYSNDYSLSSSQPYLLPNLSDTFHMARYNGCCLGNTVTSRFSMSLTGLCILEDETGLNVLRLTSIGDIFSQTMSSSSYTKDIKLYEDDMERLEYWENECEIMFSKEGNCCTAAKIQDDKHIMNCLRTSKEYIEPYEKIDFAKVPWGVSKKELLSYCDFLAPKILEEWGIEDIDEWAPELIDQPHDELCSSDEEEAITEKVSKWMEKYIPDDEETNYYISEGSDEDEAILVDLNELESDNKPQELKVLPPVQDFIALPADTKPTMGF